MINIKTSAFFTGISAICCYLCCACPYSAAAAMTLEPAPKQGIVLASFGTSYPGALTALTAIQRHVQHAFPDSRVELAFTSNIIRKIWHKRQNNSDFLLQHPDVPANILHVQGPLATIANLQDEGYRTILVQPTLIYAGEEFMDLCSYVTSLNQIKTIKSSFQPFDLLRISRPALGTFGNVHPYYEDLERAAKALKCDVDTAKDNDAALVYMGHGNEFFSTGSYSELEKILRTSYPDVPIFIGTVEGNPTLDDVKEQLLTHNIKKVILKPLMVVAGDHANNDMAGSEDDSWKNNIEHLGIEVTCILHGLGENPAWADIYVQNLHQLMEESRNQ